ncbi:DUF883 family protein [Duganella sp. CY15W]|uniref:DUF883 family protein n=1 Tax=Duganella sp. CY15W TaxID=2692172 RepID=UPI00136E52C2|nr:DUF883 family protein [Duganella sp. CY15W]MYM30932.1 DUF883 family protein [Duganella sp. CY15W]
MESTEHDTISTSQNAASNARGKLMDELTHTISEAEKWLSEHAEEVSAAASATRARFDEALHTARDDLRKLEDSLLAHGRNAAECTNAYVQENPWKAVGLGAALGVLVGVLITRK